MRGYFAPREIAFVVVLTALAISLAFFFVPLVLVLANGFNAIGQFFEFLWALVNILFIFSG